MPTRFATAVPNSVVSLTPHTVIVSLTRSNSYAMLMRLIFHRRFCVGTVLYNRFSRMFARKCNDDSNLFTHAQIQPTLLLKIFNDIVVRCYSSTERLLIACVSWKLRKFKLPEWINEQFWRSELARLTNSLKNVSCIDSDRKESSEAEVYPCFLTNRRGYIINGWWLVDDWWVNW